MMVMTFHALTEEDTASMCLGRRHSFHVSWKETQLPCVLEGDTASTCLGRRHSFHVSWKETQLPRVLEGDTASTCPLHRLCTAQPDPTVSDNQLVC